LDPDFTWFGLDIPGPAFSKLRYTSQSATQHKQDDISQAGDGMTEGKTWPTILVYTLAAGHNAFLLAEAGSAKTEERRALPGL